jgi:hypothetical protein
MKVHDGIRFLESSIDKSYSKIRSETDASVMRMFDVLIATPRTLGDMIIWSFNSDHQLLWITDGEIFGVALARGTVPSCWNRIG